MSVLEVDFSNCLSIVLSIEKKAASAPETMAERIRNARITRKYQASIPELTEVVDCKRKKAGLYGSASKEVD
jgi:aspartate carbamoyltransferase regulatory subunit